mgnify:CR=1 FL=1
MGSNKTIRDDGASDSAAAGEVLPQEGLPQSSSSSSGRKQLASNSADIARRLLPPTASA